jgi:hypothetical protein|tara:strand:+ start:3287 stop:3736 length:450 start_codon:yes stop_codon:yes gene_type:complete
MFRKKIIFLTLFFFTISCTEKIEKKTKPLNPNGDSELALIMRELQVNTSIIKDEIEKEYFDPNAKINNDYFKQLVKERFKLNTAQQSDENLKSTNTYSNFAATYNYSVSNFLNNKITTKNYNNMINNCISCHQQFCLGTIATINKLKIK